MGTGDDLERMLIAVEHRGWQALADGSGAAFYEQNLTPNALMVFPFGTLTRDESIEAIKSAPPWASFRIEEPRVVKLTEDSAVLAYRATAQRPGQAPYVARMTTVFVKWEGTWKTAFHQQTPLTT